MEGFMDAYLRRLNQRVAAMETYSCHCCKNLVKENEELKTRITKLELEIAEIYRRNMK